MDNAIYCVWCGCENIPDGKKCRKCGKSLEAKENLLVDFLVEHTKDKLKGDVEDGIFEALKNYLLSHLYSVIIAVTFVVTAVAAVVIAVSPDPAAHIQQVTHAPITQNMSATQDVLATQDAPATQDTLATENTAETQQVTESATYVLTQEDKDQIDECLLAFTQCMEHTRYVGDDIEFLNYLISDALEESIGYDSYVDMYPDHVHEDVYDFHHCEYGEVVIDQDTWSTEPLTQNGKELVDLGYTIATVYVDYSFYGKLEGSTTAPTVLIGSPRYLMTFAIENDQWLLVEQINVKDRWDERQDALL